MRKMSGLPSIREKVPPSPTSKVNQYYNLIVIVGAITVTFELLFAESILKIYYNNFDERTLMFGENFRMSSNHHKLSIGMGSRNQTSSQASSLSGLRLKSYEPTRGGLSLDNNGVEQKWQEQRNSSSTAVITNASISLLESFQHQQQRQRTSSSVSVAPPQANVGVNDNSNQTYLVLHVGPSKTGTSTIQSISRGWMNTFPLDNYIYDGRKSREQPSPLRDALMDFDCRKQVHNASLDNNSSIPACWEQMERVLTDYQGKNVFMSEELLHFERLAKTPNWWISFQELTEKLGFKIVIVITYRRLYEWLPSYYGQKYKLSKPQYQGWPVEGNEKYKSVGPIRPYVLSNAVLNTSFHSESVWEQNVIHFWLPEYLRAIPSNVERRIFNFHTTTPRGGGGGGKEESLERRFFCENLPNAMNLCNKFNNTKKGGKSRVTNQGGNSMIVFDVLVVAAAKAGLVDTSRYDRSVVRKAAAVHNSEGLNRTHLDLPYLCLTEDEINHLMNVSLHWEKELMPSMDDEASHNAGVWEYLAKKKFCDVDTGSVLKLPEWQEFFKQFAPEPVSIE